MSLAKGKAVQGGFENQARLFCGGGMYKENTENKDLRGNFS
jgi:hypothetical protein